MGRRQIYAGLGILIVVILATTVSGSVSGQLSPEETAAIVEQALEEQLIDEGTADFVIQFQQADLSQAYELGLAERRQYVYETLKASAEETQAEAIAYLESRGLSYQSFFAGNELYVYAGDLQAANDLAEMQQAVAVRAVRDYVVDPTISAGVQLDQINSLEWNIIDTGAPDFWGAFGVQGDGIRVATLSTGVQPDHPALATKYACGANTANPDCWLDATATCGDILCDDNGSGTQVTGVILGDDGGANQIGMAPNATWIACRACVGGSCTLADINECADWILAPNGNYLNAPDIVYDNLTFSTSEDASFLPKVTAWRAAGIMPVTGLGNFGPTCGSIRAPGSYQETFAAAGHNNTRTIATWSGRGPSPFGHYPFTKPNISAPGVSIRTSTIGSGYASMNGASFSGAHAAGAVALLWSMNPNFIGQLEVTFSLLQSSADPAPAGNCGAPPDSEGNYTYGYGFLDVYAAGQKLVSSWRIADPTPFDYTRLGCVWFDNGSGISSYNQKAYCMGGRSGTTPMPDIWSFDPYTQIWSDTFINLGAAVANISPVILIDSGSVSSGPAIYVVSGSDVSGVFLDTVQRFYPKVGLVNTVATDPWPMKVSGIIANPGGCASANEKLYCFGGFENTSAPYNSAETWEYDPAAPAGSRWTNIGKNLSLARGYIQVAAVGDIIYAMGGDTYTGSDLVPQIVSEYLDTNNLAAGWQMMDPLPIASGEGQGFAWMDKLYLVGGGDWSSRSALVEEYDLTTSKWNLKTAPLWFPRRNHGGFLVPLLSLDPEDALPSMWVVGGYSTGDSPPYSPAEYYRLPILSIFLPVVIR